MNGSTSTGFAAWQWGAATTPRVEARAARGDLERALDTAGWPWSRRLSRWLDVLIVIEEGDRAC